MCLAAPMLLVEKGAENTGKTELHGVKRRVSLALVPQAGVGDYLLVHAGCAIAVVDEEEALKTLDLFKHLEETFT